MSYKEGIDQDMIMMGMPYFNSYYVIYDFETSTIAMSGLRTSLKK